MANRVADQSPSETAVRPAWLRSRRATATAIPHGNTMITQVEVVPPRSASPSTPRDPSDWIGWVIALVVAWWQSQYRGWGLAISLTLHTLICLILGMWFFSESSGRGLLLSGSFDVAQDGQENGEDLDVPVDTRLDTSFGNVSSPVEFVAPDSSDVGMLAAAESLLEGGGAGSGDGEGDGEGAAASMVKNIRAPASAITKGSFTVWTEPEDPRPRTPYDIIIQVKLPRETKNYRLSDLSGYVEGTDGYRKQIKYTTKDRRAVKDGVVQITVKIPGGAQLVKDVIQIRSKLLREEQTINIEF